eukprot:TRINITY_DN4869_c0_g1_i1.p1 TRINITY_DN4869_c0_g1~~TRINITY_DN4869_c0_g1_i1.p1  ORF type:complete len:719 (-),score=214.20 TRINITY_DN4869_c0_g1_i1:116-2236(-)
MDEERRLLVNLCKALKQGNSDNNGVYDQPVLAKAWSDVRNKYVYGKDWKMSKFIDEYPAAFTRSGSGNNLTVRLSGHARAAADGIDSSVEVIMSQSKTCKLQEKKLQEKERKKQHAQQPQIEEEASGEIARRKKKSGAASSGPVEIGPKPVKEDKAPGKVFKVKEEVKPVAAAAPAPALKLRKETEKPVVVEKTVEKATTLVEKSDKMRRGRKEKGNASDEAKNENVSFVEPTARSYVPLAQRFEQISCNDHDMKSDDNKSDGRKFQLSKVLVESSRSDQNRTARGVPLRHADNLHDLDAWGLLGKVISEKDNREDDDDPELVYLNTKEPFCAVLVGVQGSGKSHSAACLIENCMIEAEGAISAAVPPCSLIFHYDTDESNFCEASTIIMPSKRIEAFASNIGEIGEIVVLVSPSFFHQRQEYYKGIPKIKVRPLLFRWEDLNANQLKSLMRINLDDEQPLYMGVLLDLLRKYQKQNKLPTFESFKSSLENQGFNQSQNAPLRQRIRLLESLLAGSDENSILLPGFEPFESIIAPGRLVIADLTDPMLSSDEANGVFEVLLSLFKTKSLKCGKLVVFDEAHKYMSGKGSDSLCSTIVEIVRQMRHHDIRVVVSSQNPKALQPELLELCSITLMHRFHSWDWYAFLQSKLPLDEEAFSDIIELETGQALVFSTKWSREFKDHKKVRKMQMRARITADGGASRAFSRI